VVDYKLSGSTLSLDRVYHGISLQLLTYLLVLQANGEAIAGKPLTPAAAFYVKLLRRLEDIEHPDDGTPPEEEAFHLRVKPRGLIHRAYVPAIDQQLQPGWSDVVQVHIKRDGDLGNLRTNDAAQPHEFAALLSHVEQKLAELGDQIIAGKIDVEPYRMGQQTPCSFCDYRPVCRFDTLTNQYHHLPAMDREGVLEQISVEAAGKEARDGR